MGRKAKETNKAITKTVSILEQDLTDIKQVYGTLTSGVKVLAGIARMILETKNKEI